MTERYHSAGVEPTLFEVTSDPIVRALMRRDGVTLVDIWTLVTDVRARHARDSNLLACSAKVDREAPKELVHS